MGLRIFEVDPDAAPRQGFTDDVVGRFRSGAQVNNRPMALDEWRITTGDPEVADRVAALFGGSPQEWQTNGEDGIEVYTDRDEIEVILDGPDAIKTSMVLWGRNALIRSCDGVTQNDEKSSPCVCPTKVADRKDAAKAGHGCEPSIQVYFRLADDPDLGKFKFFSGSWSLAAEVGKAEDALAAIGGKARATLSLEKVEYTNKTTGKAVSFTKPVVTVIGPAEPDGAALREAA